LVARGVEFKVDVISGWGRSMCRLGTEERKDDNIKCSSPFARQVASHRNNTYEQDKLKCSPCTHSAFFIFSINALRSFGEMGLASAMFSILVVPPGKRSSTPPSSTMLLRWRLPDMVTTNPGEVWMRSVNVNDGCVVRCALCVFTVSLRVRFFNKNIVNLKLVKGASLQHLLFSHSYVAPRLQSIGSRAVALLCLFLLRAVGVWRWRRSSISHSFRNEILSTFLNQLLIIIKVVLIIRKDPKKTHIL
jgi:hypothetical protein